MKKIIGVVILALGLLFFQCYLMFQSYNLGKSVKIQDQNNEDLQLCRIQQNQQLYDFKADIAKYQEMSQ